MDFVCLNVDNMTLLPHNTAVFLEKLRAGRCMSPFVHIRVVSSPMQVPVADQVQLFGLVGIKYGGGVNMSATIVSFNTVSEITVS